MQVIDLTFPLLGGAIPLDHAYPLYVAIGRAVPKLHGHKNVGIHPIRGLVSADGTLLLTKRSQLVIRVAKDAMADLAPLAGRELDLDGHAIDVGPAQAFALKPALNLAAQIVTIPILTDPDRFVSAVSRQLEEMGISPQGRVEIPPVPAGRPDAGEPMRRALHVMDQTVVGFALRVTGLRAKESLKLQAEGLGSRRHLGCGIFIASR